MSRAVTNGLTDLLYLYECITTLTFRYNGKAGSNGFQVFAADLLQEWKGP